LNPIWSAIVPERIGRKKTRNQSTLLLRKLGQ